MAPPVEEASLVLGIIGALLMTIFQIIPQIGLAYRPFHKQDPPGMCVYGQLPTWLVAVVFFLGFTMLWAGLLVTSLKSNREGVSNNKLVIGFMVLAWLLFVGGHVLIHLMGVVYHSAKDQYHNQSTPGPLSKAAQDYMFHRVIGGVVLVAVAGVIMAVSATAIHTFQFQALGAFGYIFFFIGWGLLLRLRFRIVDRSEHEIGAFATAVPFWLAGLGIIVWNMSTGTVNE